MKIVLAIDDSKFSDAATQAVIAQNRPQETEVHVVHVIQIISPQLPEMLGYYPGIEHSRDAQRKFGEAFLEKTAELLRSKGLRVTMAVEFGSPKSEIIDAAERSRADLIVLGSHGQTGLEQFLLGSVSDTVVRHAHCSVELVRVPPNANDPKDSGAIWNGQVKKILLAIDDSKFSEAATEFLIRQAWPSETQVRILSMVEAPPLLVAREMGGYDAAMEAVWDDRTNKAQALVAKTEETLRAKGLNVTTAVKPGEVKSGVLDAAEEWKADLIVLGSHGRTGLDRFLMGSVADAVARHARCSVQIVRIRPDR
jgi:nucleotide-binding universal stress UspA family protein